MKLIETKTTTTLFDSNGKQISIVRKEQTVLEDNRVIRPVSRVQGIQVQKIIADYKNEFQLKKDMQEAIQKHSAASKKNPTKKLLVFDIETGGFNMNQPISMMHVTGIPKHGKSNFVIDTFIAAAQRVYETDAQINKAPMRRDRKVKRHNRPRN